MKPKPRGPRYRSLYASAALVLALGCTREPYVGQVQPYGRQFIVSYRSIWGARAAFDAEIRDANRYCDERGLRMVPDSAPHEGVPRGALIFRCLRLEDPELRPETRPTP
jgi:hypothetical protein